MALGLSTPAARATDEPVERPLAQLRARAGAPLPLGERLVLGGWITHVCAEERRLALLDGDSGQVFGVDDAAWLRPLATGTWIRVEATVEARQGRWLLRQPRTLPQARPLAGSGDPPVPPADAPGFLDLHSASAVGRWLTLRATVRAIEAVDAPAARSWRLRLAREGQRLSAEVCRAGEADLFPRPGDTVEITGVLAPTGREAGGIPFNRLLVQNPSCVRPVARGAGNPFDLELAGLDEIQRALGTAPLGAQVRTRGQITHRTPGGTIWLEAGGAALQARLAGADASGARVGDWVDAAGFSALVEGLGLLEDATLRPLGRRDPLAPTRVTPGPETAADWHDHLVRCPGRLDTVHREASGVRLGLTLGETAFDAFLPRHAFPVLPPGLDPGASIEVTGICSGAHAEGARSDGGLPAGFSLLARDPADLAVIARAPFWNADRLRRAFAWGAACLAVAIGWIFTLRAQVIRRSRRLAEEIQARHAENVAFTSVLEERKRLAADLHDSLAQSLTAVDYQLQAAGLARERAPENLDKHLDLARRLLDQGRTELRRSLWDLRAEALDLQDLAGALRAMASRRAWGDSLHVEVTVEGDPRPIPDLISNHLLRIAQEAVRNSRENGGASRVDITLAHAPDRIELRLCDNGSGFDPATAPGPQSGHLGLTSMRERAHRLGGTFTLESQPGQGTRIRVDIPLSASA